MLLVCFVVCEALLPDSHPVVSCSTDSQPFTAWNSTPVHVRISFLLLHVREREQKGTSDLRGILWAYISMGKSVSSGNVLCARLKPPISPALFFLSITPLSEHHIFNYLSRTLNRRFNSLEKYQRDSCLFFQRDFPFPAILPLVFIRCCWSKNVPAELNNLFPDVTFRWL